MKTDALIHLLAHDLVPVDPRVPARRLASVLLLGTGAAALMAAGTWGIRNWSFNDFSQAMLWWRWAYCGGVLAVAAFAFSRLARPGASTHGLFPLALLPFAGMGLLALAEQLGASPGEHEALLMGQSATACPWNILWVSLPVLWASLWAMKQMAPTRPGWAGASAGLMAGAAGALGYTLHCPELAASFLAVWYALGMGLCAALGAAIGLRYLRW